MTGYTNYSSDLNLNYWTGQPGFPVTGNVFMALFTAVGTDAGTGFTEVSGGSYARLQLAGTGTTNNTTASGNPTLHFATTPSWVVAGMFIFDTTTSGVIPASTTVLSTTTNTVTMSANATAGGVGNGDTIRFSAFNAASGTAPSTTSNAATVSFVQSSAAWGTIIGWGFYDASTSGNLSFWDYIGNYTWNPFTCTSASPGVLTSPAHGYSNGDSVVVTAEYGGTLPTTGGSWSGLLTVAGVTTDTFTAGVNTTGTGDGQVRKVTSLVVGSNPTTITFTGGMPGNIVLTGA